MAELDRAVERTVVELAVAVTENLVESTPVDSGWAKSNWIPSVGKPTENPVGSRDSVSSAAQVSGKAGLQNYSIKERAKAFITNNVGYISALNDGHSTQAPSGFVQAAIQRALKSIARRRNRN